MGLFDELKSQARDIEREINSKLDTLHEINSRLQPDILEVASEKNPESIIISRLDSLLLQLKEICASLQKASENQYEKSQTLGFLQTHKDTSKTLNELKLSLQDKRWQQQLYGNQINNIDFTKTEMLMKEEKYLDESLEMGKNILAAAKEVRVSMAYQTQRLNSTAEKVKKFAGMIPGINFIMKRISARHKVNAIVIGIAIAICLCIIVYKIF